MPEGCVSGKVAGKDVPRRCELLADEPEPKEPGPHGVFRVFDLLGLRACRPYLFRHLAEREAKLYVALQLAGVYAALALRGRLVELEKPELDGAFVKVAWRLSIW